MSIIYSINSYKILLINKHLCHFLKFTSIEKLINYEATSPSSPPMQIIGSEFSRFPPFFKWFYDLIKSPKYFLKGVNANRPVSGG